MLLRLATSLNPFSVFQEVNFPGLLLPFHGWKGFQKQHGKQEILGSVSPRIWVTSPIKGVAVSDFLLKVMIHLLFGSLSKALLAPKAIHG